MKTENYEFCEIQVGHYFSHNIKTGSCKLNKVKAEMILISIMQSNDPFPFEISLNDPNIKFSQNVRNLGVSFDGILNIPVVYFERQLNIISETILWRCHPNHDLCFYTVWVRPLQCPSV